MGLKTKWCATVALAALQSTTLWAAQDAPELVEDRSYMSCLTPATSERGSPEYPSRQLFSKTGGQVQVVLTFTDKDSAPKVKVLNSNQWNEDAFDDFSRSVERFVSRYRLPCLTEGKAELRQDFRFSPDDKKAYAMDAADGPSEWSKADCKYDYLGEKPVYPSSSQMPTGNVYVRLKFLQRDEPPVVTVVFGGGHYQLAEITKSWMAQYRLRCAKPLEAPVETTHIHRFTPVGGVPVTLKDMGLVPFLQSVDRKSLGTPKFDTNTMGCPFDVKVTLLQPHAPNTVRELVRSEPSRKDFLQWITTLRFKYPEGFERYLVGDTTTVTVPCMALDLT